MSLIERLLRLYRVDAQVRGLRSRVDSAQRYLDAQSRLAAEVTAQRDELLVRSKQVQASIALMETEVATIDERLEKLRDELNAAATNKQYTAILTELNTFKESRNGVEDRMLQEMEQTEQLATEVEHLEGQLAEREKVRDAARSQLEERTADVGDRLAELEAERAEAAEAVPADVLATFDEQADHHDGEALAPIEEVSRRHREYACGACNMSLPFERVSLLMTGVDDLVRCTACHRILYLQDELRGALAKK